MIAYNKVPAGHWFRVTPDHPSNRGTAEGMIYPPCPTHKGVWRICFGSCTDHTSHLQGKVKDYKTLAACKHQLHLQFAYF